MTLAHRSLPGLVAATALIGRARAETAPLEQVAQFEQQVTGVAVAPTGRTFVNFPRWGQDVAMSVAEVMRDGTLKPYPDAGWNAWRNEKKLSNQDHFVCVQSVTVDPQGFLWVLDPAARGNEFIVDGGPKLVKIDLGTNKVVNIIPFGRDVCPQGSYLNDVRVSPDGKTAYLTDSGIKGALLVVDIPTHRIKRALDGVGPTQAEPDVVVMTDGKPLKRSDGRELIVAADGIALDPKGEFLYWQALTGRTLYRAPTAVLRAGGMIKVERLGTTCVSDGYWMDKRGRLFITSPEDNSVKLRKPDGTLQIVAQDDRLRWPDSLAEGADGALFVTASHIQDMGQWHDRGSTRTMPYGLFRFMPPA